MAYALTENELAVGAGGLVAGRRERNYIGGEQEPSNIKAKR